MKIKLTSGNYSIDVDSVDIKNPDKWKIVESETYRPSKDNFILNKFHSDWPQHKVAAKSAEMVYSICSRATILINWLREANASYSIETTPPLYLEGIISPEKFINATESLNEINNINREYSIKNQKTAKNFNEEMDNNTAEHVKKLEKFKENKIVRILNMNSTELPISMQFMIENFTPTVNANSVDKKTYARELLVNYKVSLLKFFNEENNKDININDFLISMSEK